MKTLSHAGLRLNAFAALCMTSWMSVMSLGQLTLPPPDVLPEGGSIHEDHLDDSLPWEVAIYNVGDLPRLSPGGQVYFTVEDRPVFVAIVTDALGVQQDSPVSLSVNGEPYMSGNEFEGRGDYTLQASCVDPHGHEVTSGQSVRFYDYEYIPIDFEVSHYDLAPADSGYQLDMTVLFTAGQVSVFDINTASLNLWVGSGVGEEYRTSRFWVEGVYPPEQPDAPVPGSAVVADGSTIYARFVGEVPSNDIRRLTLSGSSMSYARDFVFDGSLAVPEHMGSGGGDGDWPGGPEPGVIIDPGPIEPVECRVVHRDTHLHEGFDLPDPVSGMKFQSLCMPFLRMTGNWWLAHQGHGWSVDRAMAYAQDVHGDRHYTYSGGGSWKSPVTREDGHGTVSADEVVWISCNSACRWDAIGVLKGSVVVTAHASVDGSWFLGGSGRSVAISGATIEATFNASETFVASALAAANVSKDGEVTISYPPGISTTIPLTSGGEDMPIQDHIPLNQILGTEEISGSEQVHLLFVGHSYVSASAQGSYRCLGMNTFRTLSTAIANTPTWDVRIEYRFIPHDDCRFEFEPVYWP